VEVAVLLVLVGALAGLWRPAREFAARALGLEAPRPRQYVVVVPFTLVGEPAPNRAFAAGLLETVTSKLTQLEPTAHSLSVIPASEDRRARVESAHDVRLAFGATLAVTGSLQILSELVRVTINLVDATREVQLKSVMIDREPSAIARLQESIAYEMATMLSVELDPAARQRLASSKPTGAPSYESYMHGLGYLQLYRDQLGGTVIEDRNKLDSAILYFHRSLPIDSNYADCQAAMGEACWRAYRLLGDDGWLDSALSHALRAIEPNPRLSSSYLTLGRIHEGIGRYPEAVFEYRQALGLDATATEGYLGLADTYVSLNRLPEAEETYRRLLEAHPSDLRVCCRLALFYTDCGRYEEARLVEKQFGSLPAEGYADLNRLRGATSGWTIGRARASGSKSPWPFIPTVSPTPTWA
jgi:tetratricopeptide (TPR) repeat protein